MDQGLLVTEQTTGGQKLVDQLLKDGLPTEAAFWTKTDDDDRWYLYVVTPMVENPGPLATYRLIRAAIEHISWADVMERVDVSDIKVLEPTHPLAKTATALTRRYPGPLNTWVRAEWVRDGAVSGTYVYGRVAAPAATPAG